MSSHLNNEEIVIIKKDNHRQQLKERDSSILNLMCEIQVLRKQIDALEKIIDAKPTHCALSQGTVEIEGYYGDGNC